MSLKCGWGFQGDQGNLREIRHVQRQIKPTEVSVWQMVVKSQIITFLCREQWGKGYNFITTFLG